MVASDAALFLVAAAAERESFMSGRQCCSVFKFVFLKFSLWFLGLNWNSHLDSFCLFVRPIHNHDWVGNVNQHVINVMAKQSRFQHVPLTLGFWPPRINITT